MNIAAAWRLEGQLADGIIERGWEHLIQRHASLRTCFDVVDGEPVQLIEPYLQFPVSFHDLRLLPEPEAQLAAEQIAIAEARSPFDLSIAPLIRFSRIALTDIRSTFLITAHRMIVDRESLGTLVQELGDICSMLRRNESIELAKLPATFGEFVEGEHVRLQHGSFKRAATSMPDLQPDHSTFQLPSDRPRKATQTWQGRVQALQIDHSTTSLLGNFAQRRATTIHATFLGALLFLFHRYTGETDITISTQISARERVELTGIIGNTLDTKLLSADLSGDPTFTELLARMSGNMAQTLHLGHFPLDRLDEMVNTRGGIIRASLPSINVLFEQLPMSVGVFDGFTLEGLPSCNTGALFDMNFIMSARAEGWTISCEYSEDLFDDATVTALLERFELALRSIVANSDQHISRIPLLSESERQELVFEANQTRSEYPGHQTLVQLFADQVAATPNATAVVCGESTLTYAQLDERSNRLARELIGRDFGRGKRLGIFLDRSSDLVIALLAVLKAGSAYVPLDPTYPQERLAFIAENARLSAIISRSTLSERINELEAQFLNLDTMASAIEQHSVEPVQSVALPRDLAYVIYTSGSTGQPKGVQIEHRSVVNFLFAMASSPGMCSADVLLAVTTISFDIAVLEVFLPLVTGARLVIADESAVADGVALLALARHCNATIMQATPITWQILIEAGWAGDPCLKMLCGGEALSRRLADQLLERGSDLWNMYGPTETTIWSSAARVTSAGPVLIGPPIANTQFYVLDSHGDLVPRGVPGELFIGGDGVARGYFDRPDLTRERFVPDPFSGASEARLYRTGDIVRRCGVNGMQFLGRSDQQIKLRGLRIELGEIEAVLLRQTDVAQAVAVVYGATATEQTICAFVVRRSATLAAGNTWVTSLRLRISESLPYYMIPAPIVILDEIPRTPNGKIDRRALLQFIPTGPPEIAEPPANETEITLANLVADSLGRKDIGRDDDILALGLNSLLAMRLVDHIEKAFGARLPLSVIYDEPTIAQLATRLVASPSETAFDDNQPIVTFNPGGSRQPFFYFHNDMHADGMYCRKLAAVAGHDQPFYAMAPHGTAGLGPEPTIEGMGRDYLPRIRALQPAGPYRLGGFCAGGLVAYEVARLLRAQGETVERLVLINAAPVARNPGFTADTIVRHVGLNARLKPRFRETLCWNIARFVESIGLGPQVLLSFSFQRAVAVLSALSRRTNRSRMGNFEMVPLQKGDAKTEIYLAHFVAAMVYHPQAYDGELSVVWSVNQPPGEAPVQWSPYADRLRIVQMDGGHISPLYDRVEELGHVLNEFLR